MAQERATPPSAPSQTAGEWDVLTAELRAYRNQQKQTWGDLDTVLIGRYLAGEVTADERRMVEAALKDHPELRKLTDLVLDVLNEFEPIPSETPVQPEKPNQPRLLSFTQHTQTRRPFLNRVRERGALAAAACLILALSVTLLRLPQSGSVPTAARTGGPIVAEVLKPPDFSDDRFPVPEPRLKPSAMPEPVVSLDQIKAVASWSERRLGDRVSAKADLGPKFVAFRAPGGMGGAPPRGEEKKGAERALELGRAVPYLVTGVLQEKDRSLQNRCGEVLGRITPLARDAVPTLTRKLARCNCPEQQQVVVEVLRNFGPAAKEAAPALAELAANGSAAVRSRAVAALRSIRPPRWLGVQDTANALSAKTRRFVNEQARVLDQKHHFSFVAETVATLPAHPTLDKAKQKQALTDLTFKRCCEANAERDVFVLICPQTQTVEVTLGRNFQGKDARLTSEAVRKAIQNGLQQNNLAKGLEDAVRLVDKELSGR